MKKRGQTAAFVVLGIVIVAVVVILIYLGGTRTRSAQTEISATQVDIDNAIKEVNELVETCFERVARESIASASTYGGFASKSIIPGDSGNCFPSDPGDYIPIPFLSRGEDVVRIPYVYGCTDFLPSQYYCPKILNMLLSSLEPVGNCMEMYFENSFEVCIKNFNEITSKGWGMDENNDLLVSGGTRITSSGGSKYRVEVDVDRSGGVFFTLQIPRTFTKGGQSFSINEFSYENYADFGQLVKFANTLYRDHALDGSSLRGSYVDRKTQYDLYAASSEVAGKGYVLESGSSVYQADYFRITDQNNEDVVFEFVFSFKRPPCDLTAGQTPATDACCDPLSLDPNTCYTFDEVDFLGEVFEDFYGPLL